MGTALFCLVQQAQRIIGIRQHQGEHPRIGAVDVVPWIPLQGVTMEDCVDYAKTLGSRVGAELDIPVFLYEQACVVSSRRKLEVIRRGGLSALQERMSNQGNWKPDYGPGDLHHSFGAMVIGARFFLIAFNVVLASRNLELACHIAGTIRESGGGLPAVKAMGVSLPSRGVVQVSMNLVDFRLTSMRAAYQAVEREATIAGVDIVESEIVGMVPQAAWDNHMSNDLKLSNWTSDRIIEIGLAKQTLF
jgi:glutamate formiminotransferase/glutamate formiminotransferase/formiminotetrahydrofolate cyclodeaminase